MQDTQSKDYTKVQFFWQLEQLMKESQTVEEANSIFHEAYRRVIVGEATDFDVRGLYKCCPHKLADADPSLVYPHNPALVYPHLDRASFFKKLLEAFVPGYNYYYTGSYVSTNDHFNYFTRDLAKINLNNIGENPHIENRIINAFCAAHYTLQKLGNDTVTSVHKIYDSFLLHPAQQHDKDLKELKNEIVRYFGEAGSYVNRSCVSRDPQRDVLLGQAKQLVDSNGSLNEIVTKLNSLATKAQNHHEKTSGSRWLGCGPLINKTCGFKTAVDEIVAKLEKQTNDRAEVARNLAQDEYYYRY